MWFVPDWRGRMNGRTDTQTHRHADRLTLITGNIEKRGEHTHILTDRLILIIEVYARTRQTGGLVDGRMDGRTDTQTHRQIYSHYRMYTLVPDWRASKINTGAVVFSWHCWITVPLWPLALSFTCLKYRWKC